MRNKLKKIPFFYYWKQTLKEGIKVKYPVENFLSKHKFVPIIPLYFQSLVKSWKTRRNFNQVKTYCMFLGNQRSGHSLIASLIDAHPNIIISHEVNALKYWSMGFSRNQIFSLLLENSSSYAERGRGESGYNYVVPNQHQGKFKELLVVGDKDGRRDTSQLARFSNIIRPIIKKNEDVKIIMVVRNPFDNITTISLRNRETEVNQQDIDRYFEMAHASEKFINSVGSKFCFTINHEEVINSPKTALKKICNFLEVPASEDYLNDCASIIYSSANKSRHKLPWSKEKIEQVNKKIAKISFLNGYSFKIIFLMVYLSNLIFSDSGLLNLDFNLFDTLT